MKTTEQARSDILTLIRDVRDEAGKPLGMYAFARMAGVSPSMLYQFERPDGPLLGRATVNAIAPLLPSVDADTWLAAMGVETTNEAAADGAAA